MEINTKAQDALNSISAVYPQGFIKQLQITIIPFDTIDNIVSSREKLRAGNCRGEIITMDPFFAERGDAALNSRLFNGFLPQIVT